MIEFGDFARNKPLSSKLHPPKKTKSNPGMSGQKPNAAAVSKGEEEAASGWG